jgi:hypothetical protein
MEASDHSTSENAASNGSGQSPWAAHEAVESSAHPEIPVIGAFVGAFVLAKLLKAIGGGGDE